MIFANESKLFQINSNNLEYLFNSGSKINPIGTKVSNEFKDYLKKYCAVNNIYLSELMRNALLKYLKDELSKTVENNGNYLLMAVPLRGTEGLNNE